MRSIVSSKYIPKTLHFNFAPIYIYIYQHLRETQHNTKIFHQVKSVLKSLLTNHSDEECSNQTYRGNYLFPSWTTSYCQYAPINWHLDHNRASNYHLYIFCPLSLVRPVMLDSQWVTYASRATLMICLPRLPSSVHGGMLEENGTSWGKGNYQKKKNRDFPSLPTIAWLNHQPPPWSDQETDSTPSRQRSEPTLCFQQSHDRPKISLPFKQASISFPCHKCRFHLSPALPIPGTHSWLGQISSLSSPIGVGEATSLVPLLALQGQEWCSWAYEQGEVRR